MLIMVKYLTTSLKDEKANDIESRFEDMMHIYHLTHDQTYTIKDCKNKICVRNVDICKKWAIQISVFM